MDSAEFHSAVYDVVRQIPYGKVTTYGHIAKLIGMPRHSRHVGQALKFLSPSTNPPIPWQRVLGSGGCISSRGPGTTGADRQRQALEAEDVDVVTSRSGEHRVNLKLCGWFPSAAEIQPPLPPDDDSDAEIGT